MLPRRGIRRSECGRAHAQGILDKLALADLTVAFGIRRPCFHPADVRQLQLQFGRVFPSKLRQPVLPARAPISPVQAAQSVH